MTEYQEYVERIFKYFSSEISAELYWKLFIFANFTNSDQTQSFSDIRKALKQESKNISSKSDSFYNRFTNITQTNLESSLKRFNSEKIKRVLQYSTQEQLIRIIHVTTFNKMLHTFISLTMQPPIHLICKNLIQEIVENGITQYLQHYLTVKESPHVNKIVNQLHYPITIILIFMITIVQY